MMNMKKNLRDEVVEAVEHDIAYTMEHEDVQKKSLLKDFKKLATAHLEYYKTCSEHDLALIFERCKDIRCYGATIFATYAFMLSGRKQELDDIPAIEDAVLALG